MNIVVSIDYSSYNIKYADYNSTYSISIPIASI